MKFGENLLGLIIPEWSKMYCDYEKGKELMSELSKGLAKHTALRKVNSVTIDAVDLTNFRTLRPVMVRGRVRNTKTGKVVEVCVDLLAATDTTHDEDDEHREHSHAYERTFMLQGPNAFVVQSGLAQLSNKSFKVKDGDEAHSLLEDYGDAATECNATFFEWFSGELSKVNNFYRAKSQHVACTIAEVLDDAKECANMTRAQQRILQTCLQQCHDACGLMLSYCYVNYMALVKLSKKYLKQTQHAKGILTKVEDWLAMEYFYMDQNPTHTKNDILAMQDTIREFYGQCFHQGNMKAAEEALHVASKDEEKIASRVSMLEVGFLWGASTIFFIQAFVEYRDYSDRLQNLGDSFTIDNARYIFGLAGLVLLMMVGFAGSLLVFEEFAINYALIFELDPREHFRGLSMMRACVWQACWLMIWVYGYVHVAGLNLRGEDTEAIVISHLSCPYIYLGGMLLSLLCTTILHWSCWKWFWTAVWKSMAAPFYEVRFPDFYMCDHLTSITSVLYQAQFLVCHMKWSLYEGAYCSWMTTWKVPFLLCLPHLWRLLQCLRRYRDQKGDKYHPNLTNATKYTLGLIGIGLHFVFGAVVVMHGKDSAEAQAAEVAWYFSAVVDATSKSIWDFFMDWGLLSGLRRSTAKRPWLRDKIHFPPWVYALAATFNLFGRYVFIIRYWFATKYGAVTGGEVFNYWWGFIFFGALEVLRRSVWSVFRVENEQINNLEAYRAVTITPSPYHGKPIHHAFEENFEELRMRMEAGMFSQDDPAQRTKLTIMFSLLGKDDQSTVLRHLIPDYEESWKHETGEQRTIRFGRLQEFAKVQGLHTLFGRQTLEQFCQDRGILKEIYESCGARFSGDFSGSFMEPRLSKKTPSTPLVIVDPKTPLGRPRSDSAFLLI